VPSMPRRSFSLAVESCLKAAASSSARATDAARRDSAEADGSVTSADHPRPTSTIKQRLRRVVPIRTPGHRAAIFSPRMDTRLRPMTGGCTRRRTSIRAPTRTVPSGALQDPRSLTASCQARVRLVIADGLVARTTEAPSVAYRVTSPSA
jgi:hypothetical protein